jgi:hypothetical protein
VVVLYGLERQNEIDGGMQLFKYQVETPHLYGKTPTPLTIFVPMRVTNPLTLSDLSEDRTNVEPGSLGASKATHSSRPLFNEVNDSWSELSNHSSSRAYDISATRSKSDRVRFGVFKYQGSFLLLLKFIDRQRRVRPSCHSGRMNFGEVYDSWTTISMGRF